MKPRQVIDTLRTSGRDLELIISDLERGVQFETADLRRSLKRWKFTAGKAVVTLMRDTGPGQTFVVAPRNLSSQGIGLIHGGYVHTKTRCIVSIRRTDGKIAHLHGTVVRCAHVRAQLHDIGIKFDSTIDPEGFVDRPEGSRFNVEKVELNDLRGSLLVIEDSTADQRLVAHYFKDANLDVRFAKDIAIGTQMLADAPDIVFVDFLLPDGDGISFIEQARTIGYPGPMLLITADTTPGLRERARRAGASEVLSKPCPKELLHQAAAEYLVQMTSLSESGHGPIISSAKENGLSIEMLDSYIGELKKHADDIANSLSEDDLDGLKRIATLLKGNAQSYGFEPIGRAAEDLLRTLNSTMSVEESRPLARRLSEFCLRARPMQ
ncbi:MAG: response regulator [Phycisphaerales bacterium JB065]